MVTTFERLAKILKGYIKPANWIERAFAELASAISSVLPSVSDSDRGKFLGVNSSNNNLGWKAIKQVPEVENADKGKYLHANEDTGALEWSEAGGSACNCLAVTWTLTENYDTTTEENTVTRTSSATFNEIVYAMEHNIPISAIYIAVNTEDITTIISKGVQTSGIDVDYTNGVATSISMTSMFDYHLESDNEFHQNDQPQ